MLINPDFENAYSPNSVILSGNVIFFNILQLLNTPFPIFSKLLFSSNITSLSLSHSLNILFLIFITLLGIVTDSI